MFLKRSPRKGHDYYEVVETIRVDGKPRHVRRLYLGNLATITQEQRRTLEAAVRDLKDPKIAQRFRALMQRLGHAPDLIAVSEMTVERALDYGAVAALTSVSDKLGLPKMLSQTLAPKGGGATLGKLLVAQAIRRCIDPGSILAMPDWYGLTALPALLDLPANQVTKDTLYHSLDYVDEVGAQEFHEAAWKQVKALYETPDSPTFYDMTTSYFEGTQCPLARFGYSEEHRPDKLQITVGVAVNPDMVPLHHHVYEGNQGQAPTMDEVRQRMLGLDLKRPILIVDRGLGSKENRQALRDSGIDYIMGLRQDPELQQIMRAHDAKDFEVVDVPEGSSQLSVCELEREVMETHPGKPDRVVTVRLVLALNPDKVIDDAQYREDCAKRAETGLTKLAARQSGNKPLAKKELVAQARAVIKTAGAAGLFKVLVGQRGRPRLSWQRDEDTMLRLAQLDGKSIFETNCKPGDLDTKAVALAYRDRDVVEKFFQCLKDIVEFRPHYVRTAQHVRGRALVCVIAVLLLSLLRLELKAAGKQLTGLRALTILEGVRRVEISPGDGSAVIVKTTKLTDAQRELAHVFHLAI